MPVHFSSSLASRHCASGVSNGHAELAGVDLRSLVHWKVWRLTKHPLKLSSTGWNHHGYHLVMTNIAMENPWNKRMFIAGKIIYKGAIYTMAMLNNQRVNCNSLTWNQAFFGDNSCHEFSRSEAPVIYPNSGARFSAEFQALSARTSRDPTRLAHPVRSATSLFVPSGLWEQFWP